MLHAAAIYQLAPASAAVMSSNGDTNVVLRGVTHGAVDFLIKASLAAGSLQHLAKRVDGFGQPGWLSNACVWPCGLPRPCTGCNGSYLTNAYCSLCYTIYCSRCAWRSFAMCGSTWCGGAACTMAVRRMSTRGWRTM